MRPLAVVGNVNVDLILGPVEPWPRPGTEVMVDQDDLRVGGAAGNTALAWQAAGIPFTLAANIGNDAFGRWLAEAFGPRAALWTVEPARTTVSVGITHPDGERTFLSTQGHLRHLRWPAVRAQLEAAALEGGILLLCGTNVTDSLTADYDALYDWAAARGVDVALDTGWPVAGWTEAERTRTVAWVARSRFVLFNEVEVLGLTGGAALEPAMRDLNNMLPAGGIAVVKTGPKGACALTGAGMLQVAAPAVRVIDTIGAGDVFNAGFLMAMAQGAGLRQAMEAGVAMASCAVSTAPRRYVTQREEVV